MAHGFKAGFRNIEVLDRRPLGKEQLKLYPLFTVEFLDWIFDQFPEGRNPIYVAHFWMEKPA